MVRLIITMLQVQRENHALFEIFDASTAQRFHARLC